MLDDISRIDSAVLKPDLVKISRDRGGKEKNKGQHPPAENTSPVDEAAEAQDRLDDGESPHHLLDVRI